MRDSQKTARLQQAINAVIEQQLAANDPPEMRLTLARLIAQGLTDQEARILIGHVVVEEVLQVLAAGQAFDRPATAGDFRNWSTAPVRTTCDIVGDFFDPFARLYSAFLLDRVNDTNP